LTEPFTIFPLTKQLVEKYLSGDFKNHRHEYEEILVLQTGHPQHFIDFKKETLDTPLVVYVAKGKIHNFIPDKNTTGWVIRYQGELLPENRFNFYCNFLDTIHYRFKTNECIDQLIRLCELMYEAYQGEQKDMPFIIHLLAAFLSRLESENKRNLQGDNGNGHNQLITFNNFLKIVEENYKRPLGVDFYAEKLFMSARNLNLITHAIFNKSVSEIVENRKLIEAKKMLTHTNLSVSEIGYDLGFNEKAYFTRVFTKKVGITPTQFKSEMQTLLA
jgi:AraC family transcriptional activator of pobA